MISSPPISPRVFDTDLGGALAQRIKNVRGDLICLPFEAGYFISNDSSGATVSVVAAVGNKERSGTILNVSVPAGTNGARFQVPFFGRAFGIRFRRTTYSGTQTPAEFSVRIDGVAYRVSTDLTKARLYSQTLEDGRSNVLISDDLSEGEHIAEITCVAPTSGTDSLHFHGYLVENRTGYQQARDTDVLLTNGNTPTVATNIYDNMASSVGTNGIGRRISKVRWVNNTGGAVTDLVIKYNGVTYATAGSAGTPGSLANKDAFELSIPPNLAMNSLWTHVSSAGGANLPYFVFGSF